MCMQQRAQTLYTNALSNTPPPPPPLNLTLLIKVIQDYNLIKKRDYYILRNIFKKIYQN